MARRRTSMGRQKIEIRRIESEEARQVCFSKRRAGLFKKASELAILCGAEVAAVVFSPAGKAFSFGHPSVEAIIERFTPSGAPAVGGAGGGEDSRQLAELNRQYGELRAQLDAEKARKEKVEAAMAKERAAASPVAAWLETDVRDMGEEDLMAFAAALAEVQAAVAERANQVLQEALNHGRAMAARNANRVAPLPAPQQQLLCMGAGDNNGGFEFSTAGNSSGVNENGAGMDMQVQQMLMALPPTPGFAGNGQETMMMQQGFGFPVPF